MCSRFSAHASPESFKKRFPYLTFATEPKRRYNIAPTQSVLIVKNDSRNEVISARWGLIPSWSYAQETPRIQTPFTECEALANDRTFAPLIQRRRCIILADGFFEWRIDKKCRKIPYFIRLKSREPFAFAGIWDEWRNKVTSCALITCQANELVRTIHPRMPVIFDPADAMRWISSDKRRFKQRMSLLRSYPSELMECYPTSRNVDNPVYDAPDVLDPASFI